MADYDNKVLVDFLLSYFDYYPDRIFEHIEGSYQYPGDDFLEVRSNSIKMSLRLLKDYGLTHNNVLYYKSDDTDSQLYPYQVGRSGGIIFFDATTGACVNVTSEEMEEYQIDLREDNLNELID